MQLVSVHITAYNYGQYLAEAIRSCLAQTYQPVEIIVVDDGSTDNTREIVAGFPNVKYIYQENRGLAAAHNHALRVSRGEFIQFLDADDTISPTKIERCIEAFHAHPEADVVYTDYVVCGPDMQGLKDQHAPWVMPQGNHLLYTLVHRIDPFFPPHATLIRRHSLESVGGFNEALRRATDWDLWARLASKGTYFYFVNERLAQYRMTPDSMSHDDVKRAQGKIVACEGLRNVPEIASVINLNEVLALRHADLATKLWRHGNRAEARQHLRTAIHLEKAKRGRRGVFIVLSYFMPGSAALWFQRAFGRAKASLPLSSTWNGSQ